MNGQGCRNKGPSGAEGVCVPRNTLSIHLPEAMIAAAERGEIGILDRIRGTLRDWQIRLEPDHAPVDPAGYSLLHMMEPAGPRSLCLRLAYLYPFWRIETTNERWHFDVAKARFDAAQIRDKTGVLQSRLRQRLFGDVAARDDGFILMPLQGRLLEQRSFQSMSPVAMVKTVLARFPDRAVIATLHPRESYDPAEQAALADLAQDHPQLTVQIGGSDALLPRCHLVATQNSSVAFKGFLLNKPAILFAEIDFHHIAGSVPRDGVQAAFDRLSGPIPDYAAYVAWFLRRHAINAQSDTAEDRIRARLQKLGWPV